MEGQGRRVWRGESQMLGLHGSMHEGDKEGGCACGVNGEKKEDKWKNKYVKLWSTLEIQSQSCCNEISPW